MKKFLGFLIITFFVSLNLSWAQSLTAAQKNEIDALANEFMQTSQVPGMAIGLVKNNQLLLTKGYGWADVEQQVGVDPAQTKFRIASISKTLTADALIQLVEAGKLNLDAPVQNYVSSFPKKKWPITTRMVAGHLGGIRHYRGDEFLSSKYYTTISQGLEIFRNDSLLFEPGTKFSYSSYGYNLISAVIEGAAGMDYLSNMQLNIFDKLSMENTVPDINNQIISHRGRYYQREENGIEHAPYVDNSYKWAGGGFLSTVDDILIFAMAHTNSEYLSENSLQALFTSQKTKDGKETNYGLGWASGTDKQDLYWHGHSGGAIGGTSKLLIYPKEQIIIVVLTNLSDARLGDFPHQLRWLMMK